MIVIMERSLHTALPQLNDVNPSNSDLSLSLYLMMLTILTVMNLWQLAHDSDSGADPA
jgi:hypothetical protein